MHKLLVHSNKLSGSDIALVEKIIGKKLNAADNFYYVDEANISQDAISRLSRQLKTDINLLPDYFEPDNIKLVISDMDSTLINIECIDEIADFAGIKAEVAKITAEAMRGEIDFAESLKRRVALLEGLDAAVLQKVYNQRLRLNPGVEEMLAGLEEKKIKFALVSGGFTFFTSQLANKLQIDYSKANVLAERENTLTGEVVGDVVDGIAKREFLLEICESTGYNLKHTIAIGDGANDLAMMGIAGLSVAYRAKEIVQRQTATHINYGDLSLVLDFLVTNYQ